MRDVAALAGVGIKTVSRVFNDVPTVDPALADRVRKAATKLGYRPNLTAASLRRSGGRTDTIGLLLEDVSNPYSAALHRAVEDYARARGCSSSRRASTRTRRANVSSHAGSSTGGSTA